ncbi:MAG TPA: thioredoxin family protein [Steroidobacteraceae bacterium]|nr:thioredoxin family protein [Steroidobacteraceae bacterium]
MSLIRLLALACLLLASDLAGAAPDPNSDEFWHGTAADGTPTVRLYYFFSPTCPHCQAAAPFIDELAARSPWLEVQKFVVKDNRANARFYYETALALGTQALSVPGFVFCRQVLIGYDSAESTGAEIAAALEKCHQQRLANPGPGEPAAGADTAGEPATEAGKPAGTTVHLPFVGAVDAKALSLPVLTLVLAGMDAFNPCAFFVLLFLLSLLVHARSRARMAIVGGTFVLFSGLVYFVFMAAWLNVFLIAGELRVITVIAGLVAVLVAVLNIKDYFWFKAGPSLSIPESAKPGLFKRMREIVASGSLGPMLASTVLLAIVANSYELLCTAGFPMVYTRVLTLAGLETWQYYAWLAVYNVIYVIPLLAIVVVFVRTMGARKLSEAEGRILKLISGFMMLGFGLLLLIAPQLLTNPLASILVLLVAVGVAFVVAKVAAPRPA